jgi:AraC-like DNA-binding protein
MFDFLDIAFRAAGVGLLLVHAGVLYRDARHVRPARFGIALAIALAAVMAIESTPGFALPPTLIAILLPFNSNAAVLIWWFGLSLFDDDFRLRAFEWSVAALWFGLGILNFSDIVAQSPISIEWASAARTVLAILFVIHITYTALAGRKTDLVERRRRVRIIFSAIISALFLSDLIGEAVFGYLHTPAWASAAQHGAYLVVIVWSFFWLDRVDPSVLMFDRPAPASPAVPALSPKEQILHRKLLAVMATDKAWLDSELSIGGLAEKVAAPEHQLRALINTAMGHRNFRAFVNEFRIGAIKEDLADPEKAALPILTIAMDAGFASLSSFNRAFKEATGKTPSDWRAQALGGVSTDQN